MADAQTVPASEPVAYWLEQIESSLKWHQNFHDRGKVINERYLDRKEGEDVSTTHKMNTLWSNVETLTPAIYAKAATPKASRRFRDKDPVGRWAAIVLERALTYNQDAYDGDYAIRGAVKDYLLPGRGQVWVNYEPQIEGQKLVWECVKRRLINFKDFLTNKARTWDEVWWVAKREYLTKEEAKSQRLDVSKLSFSEERDDAPDGAKKKNKAVVWEIWSKADGKVYFVSKSSPEFLREPAPPPLKLGGFFPCPRPLTTTTTSDSILPVPDYDQYRNQAAEIDRLTQKINLLTKALRVVGIYDASAEGLAKLLDSEDNDMVPVNNWAAYFGTNGVEGSVSFLPLKDVVAALQAAYIARDQAKQTLYEVTGMSDIVRGASNPDETATAQQIKSQWGGLRVRDRQAEVQRFIRDILRIEAEICAEVFQPETLKAMSNAPLLMAQDKQKIQVRQQAQQMAQAEPEKAQALVAANPQLQVLLQPVTPEEMQQLREPAWEEVVQLLRDDKLRGFRIDVETDSTIHVDEQEEKQSRIEFITAMTSFMSTMGPMVAQMPQLGPLAGEMMEFGARAFKTAESLETAIEEFVDGINQQALLGPQPVADPKHELEQKKHAFTEKQHADQMAMQQQQAERQHAFDREKHQAEMAHRDREFQATQQQAATEQQFRAEDRQNAVTDASIQHERDLTLKGVDRSFVLEDRDLDQAEAIKIAQKALEPVGDKLAKAVESASAENIKLLQDAIEQLKQIAMAPKSIDVERDKSGKIVGGTAKPQVSNSIN